MRTRRARGGGASPGSARGSRPHGLEGHAALRPCRGRGEPPCSQGAPIVLFRPDRACPVPDRLRRREAAPDVPSGRYLTGRHRDRMRGAAVRGRTSRMYDTIDFEVDRGIGVLTLNRPHVLNAINRRMVEEIADVQSRVETDREVNVLVLAGSGPSFCAGYDLKEADARGDEDPGRDLLGTRDKLERACDMTMGFWHCRKPTLSAVHGHCVAGGCELALACDLTIASEDALFGEPELRFGAGIVCLILPWLTRPQAGQGADLHRQRQDPGRARPRDGARQPHRTRRRSAAGGDGDGAPDRGHGRACDGAQQGSRSTAPTRSWACARRCGSGVDLDVEITCLDTPDRKQFREISSREGLKAAIAWRDARFDRGDMKAGPAGGRTRSDPRPEARLAPLLAPRSIAFVGASARGRISRAHRAAPQPRGRPRRTALPGEPPLPPHRRPRLPCVACRAAGGPGPGGAGARRPAPGGRARRSGGSGCPRRGRLRRVPPRRTRALRPAPAPCRHRARGGPRALRRQLHGFLQPRRRGAGHFLPAALRNAGGRDHAHQPLRLLVVRAHPERRTPCLQSRGLVGGGALRRGGGLHVLCARPTHHPRDRVDPGDGSLPGGVRGRPRAGKTRSGCR